MYKYLLLLIITLLPACQSPSLPQSTLLLPPAEDRVAEAALRHTISLCDRQDRGTYAAYVLPQTELADRLVANLHDILPLVTNCMPVSMEGGLAHEPASDLPVKLWMVRPLTLTPPQNPTAATAEVAWYLGIGESRVFTLTLALHNGQWIVTDEKIDNLFDPAPTAPTAPPSPSAPLAIAAPATAPSVPLPPPDPALNIALDAPHMPHP